MVINYFAMQSYAKNDNKKFCFYDNLFLKCDKMPF